MRYSTGWDWTEPLLSSLSWDLKGVDLKKNPEYDYVSRLDIKNKGAKEQEDHDSR